MPCFFYYCFCKRLITLSRNLSILFLLSLINTITMIEARIIAKNVTKTVNELDVIENRFGKAIIAPVIQINDIASVNPRISVIGKQSVAKFKNPV